MISLKRFLSQTQAQTCHAGRPADGIMIKDREEVQRYIVNGVVATAVHYGVLTFNISVLGFASAGFANFVAALFGIATSFLGSPTQRY